MKSKLSLVTSTAVVVTLISVVGCASPAGPIGPTTSVPPPATGVPPVVAPPVVPAPVTPPATGPGTTGPYGFGREATDEEFAAWNIDISPDGTGLPAGSGTPAQGATVFASKCAFCHGDKGQGGTGQTTEVLVGTQPWFKPGSPARVGGATIGNYWPYATTVFDYVRRAMPFNAPQSLTNDEVYRVVAWLLNQNKIIGDGDVMDAQTLPKVQMPNRDGFVPDPRPWPEVQ